MIFKGLSLKQIKQIILEGENPTLNEPFEEKVKKRNVDSNVVILLSINKSEKFNHKLLIKNIFFLKKKRIFQVLLAFIKNKEFVNELNRINTLTCENTFFIKSRLSYMFEKQICGYESVQGMTSINFFPSSNFKSKI